MIILNSILLLNVICFAKDKACDEVCKEKVFQMCVDSKSGYGYSLNDLIRIYGENVKKIATNKDARMGFCVYAVYFNEFSKESYAKYVIPTIKYYLRRDKDFELGDLLSNLNEHMQEPGIPEVENSIKMHISEYSQEYRKIRENEYFRDALDDAKKTMRFYQ